MSRVDVDVCALSRLGFVGRKHPVPLVLLNAPGFTENGVFDPESVGLLC